MTIDLDELERLHEAATPGPWASEGACIVAGPVGARMLILYDEGGPSRDDSALIAAARNALPELLRLARRARRHYECLVGEYERLRAQLAEREAELATLKSSERERLIRDVCIASDICGPIYAPANHLAAYERARRAKEKP